MSRVLNTRLAVASMAAVLAVAAGSSRALAQFTKFTPLSNGNLQFLSIRGMSADGTTLVGDGVPFQVFNSRGFRQRFDGSFELLGVASAQSFSTAEATNASGAVIVGAQDSGGFVWTAPGPGVGVGGDRFVDVSSDGAVFLGGAGRNVGGVFTPVPLPSVGGYTEVRAQRVAGTASNFVAYDARRFIPGNGYGYPPTPGEDFTRAGRWDAGTGAQVDIGVLNGGMSSRALGISADGQVVVGVSEQATEGGGIAERPFRWSSASGIAVLPGLANGDGSGEARDASADGRVIVGTVDGRAVVWRDGGPAQVLDDVLAANGQDLQGATLRSAVAVSDDGTVVSGMASLGSDPFVGWAASLTYTCTPPASAGDVMLTTVAFEGGLPAVGSATFTNGLFGTDISLTGQVLFNSPLSDGSQGVFSDSTSFPPVQVASGMAGGSTPVGVRIAPDSRVLLLDRGASGLERVRIGVPGGLQTILSSGQSLPSTGGGSFLSNTDILETAFINDANGVIAFQVGVTGGSTGLAAFTTRTGDLERVPVNLFGQGTAFNNVQLRGITDTGAVIRSGNIVPSGTLGLVIGGPGPAPSDLVIKIGDAVPGQAAGVVFTNLQGFSGAGSQIDFIGSFIVDGNTRLGLFRASTAGVTALVLEGDVLPAIGTVRSIVTGGSNMLALNPIETVFTARVDVGGVERVMVLKRTIAGVEKVLAEGDVLPGSVCREVTALDVLAAESGRVLLSVSTPSVPGPALYVATPGGLVKVVEPGQTMNLPELGDVVVTSALSIASGLTPGGSANGNVSGLRGRHVLVNAVVSASGVQKRVILRAELPGVTVTRCSPADIADDQGTPLPPFGNGGIAPAVNNGVTEGDYNLFFSQFFDALPSCDIADDTGQPLPPFGNGGIAPFVNNGVTEGDYNLFFGRFFNGCPS